MRRMVFPLILLTHLLVRGMGSEGEGVLLRIYSGDGVADVRR